MTRGQAEMIARAFLAGDSVEHLTWSQARSREEVEEALRRTLVLRGGAQRCMQSIRDASDGGVYECRLEPGHKGPCDFARHPVKPRGTARRAGREDAP